MLRTLARWTLPVVLLLGTTGCMVWSGGRPLSRLEAREANSEAIRVVRTDGTAVELHHPRIAGDSVVGTLASKNGMRLALPASDVQEIQVRRLDPLRTAGAIAGGLVGSYVGVVTLILLSMPW